MKLIVILATALCVTLVGSSPLSDKRRLQSEALNRLMMAEADNEAALRNKRTIGILRELFPDASQMIEKKVNSIVAEIIRILGPTVLRSLIQNNGDSNSGSSSSGGSTATAESPFFDDEEDDAGNSKVSVSLPTFPPDEDTDTGAPANMSSTKASQTTAINQDDRMNEVASTVA